MIEPLPDDLARLFSIERALPPADGARRVAVRARVWKTLGLGGGTPPGHGGGFGAGVAIVVAAATVGGALLLAHRAQPAAAGATSSSSAAAPADALDPASAAAPTSAPPSLSPRFGWRSAGGAANADVATVAATDWMGQLDVAPRAIEGVVSFGTKPLAGADVTLASPSTGAGGAPLLHVISGDDGRFRFAEQPAWIYVVVAQRAGLTAATASVDLRQPGAGGNVTLALSECKTRIRGRVSDGGGGAIQGVLVSALANPWHGPSTTSDANGDYELCVAAGAARVHFAAEGYGAQERVAKVAAGGAIVDVTLAPENVVIGNVIGPEGAPRAGAQVNLWHHSANSRGGDAHAVTDATGHFEIGGVAAGRYHINAWTRDANTLTTHDILVADGVIEPLTVQLEATVRLRGFVVREGRPFAGALVWASPLDNPDARSHPARSQEDGSFTLDAVRPGDVAIVVDGKTVVGSLTVGTEGARGLYVDAGVR